MFTLAVIIGICSYVVMGLGLAGWLSPNWLLAVTVGSVLLFLYNSPLRPSLKLREGFRGRVTGALLLLLFFQALVNLVGALGPELGFDALWYHLTIPRIWLLEQKMFFIDGVFSYSVLPKLINMLYVIALGLGNEIWAKIIHWGFGLLATTVTYQLARIWLERKSAFLAAIIFYSNLVVGWQSTTAYIDLGRTFFEVLAFYLLIKKEVTKSAIVLGLAVATKLIAIGSLPIFLALLLLHRQTWKVLLRFTATVTLIPLPWFVFAWINTGNPVYPIFSGYPIEQTWRDVNILRLADPINPIYVMVLPWLWPLRRKLPATVAVYCLLSFVIWYLTPRTGGGRFLLPYLPVWSVTVAMARKKILTIFILIIALVNIVYRAAANTKYLPVVLGWQTKQEFLDTNLPKDFGKNWFYLPSGELKRYY